MHVVQGCLLGARIRVLHHTEPVFNMHLVHVEIPSPWAGA